jgi:hypothetical protein
MDYLLPDFEEFDPQCNNDLNYEKKLEDTKYLMQIISNKWEEIAGDIDTQQEMDEFTELVEYVHSNIINSLEALQEFINKIDADDPQNVEYQGTQQTKPELQSPSNDYHSYYQMFQKVDEASGGVKRLVGKDKNEQLTKSDARKIGTMIANMEGEKRKKYIATMNYMGASCSVFTQMRNAFNIARNKKENEEKNFK